MRGWMRWVSALPSESRATASKSDCRNRCSIGYSGIHTDCLGSNTLTILGGPWKGGVQDRRAIIFGPTKFLLTRFFGLGNCFSPFWEGFGTSSEKRTLKSTSSQFFALGAPILSSVVQKTSKICFDESVSDVHGVWGAGGARQLPPRLTLIFCKNFWRTAVATTALWRRHFACLPVSP